jgi:tetratricopeptide (TPR) repeat protein
MARRARSSRTSGPGFSVAAGAGHDYALRHLVKHLHGAGCMEKIFDLLVSDSNWLDLKCSRLGNEAYAEDVELAIGGFREPLETEEVARLAELHTLLHLVLQQVGRYTDLGLQILSSIGREAEAAGSARLRPWASERFDSLMAIVQALREREAAVEPWLDELTTDAWQIEETYQQGKALCELTDLLARSGHLQSAATLSAAIADPSWQPFSETVLASHFLEAGLRERAGEILAGLPAQILCVSDMTLRVGLRSALLALGSKLGIAQDVVAVIHACGEEAGTLDPPSSRAPALLMLYKSLVASGFQHEAKALLAEIRSLVDQEGILGDLLRHDMVSDLAAGGELEAPLELLGDIEDPTMRTATRAELGRALYAAGLADAGHEVLEAAVRELEPVSEPADRDTILTALAPAFVQAGERQRGLALAEEIRQATPRARALLEISSILAREQARQEAYARLQEAQELISEADFRTPRSEAIGAMALCWWSCGEESRAQRLLSHACDLHTGMPVSGTSAERRAEVAGFLASAWLRMGREDRVRRWIEELPDDMEKNAARSVLVAALLPAGRLEEARKIVETETISLGEEKNRIQMLGQVVGSLARAGSYETALAMVTRIEQAGKAFLPVYRSALEQLGQCPDRFTAGVEDSLVELHAQLAVALGPLDPPESERHLAEARRLAQGIADLPIRVRALSRLAAVSTLVGWHGMGEGLFGEAEAVAGSLSDPTAWNDAWEEVVQGYLRAGRAEAALRVVGKLHDRDRQERMRVGIASALLQQKNLDAAEAVVASMMDKGKTAVAFSGLAAALFNAGLPIRAFRVLRSYHQDAFLGGVAKWLAQEVAGHPREGHEPFATVLLRRIIRIASWRSAGWGEVYEMLGAETPVSRTDPAPSRHSTQQAV